MNKESQFPVWGNTYRTDSEITLFVKDDHQQSSRFIQFIAVNGSCTIAYLCNMSGEDEIRHTRSIDSSELKGIWEPLLDNVIDELKTVYIFPQQSKTYLITFRHSKTIKKIAGMGPIIQDDLKDFIDRLTALAIKYFPDFQY